MKFGPSTKPDSERHQDQPEGGKTVFPLVVGEWDRNKREVVRVALDQYNGRHTINLRIWYRDGDTLKPGKAGLTLSLKHLPDLAEALGAALEAATTLGLLSDEGEQ